MHAQGVFDIRTDLNPTLFTRPIAQPTMCKRYLSTTQLLHFTKEHDQIHFPKMRHLRLVPPGGLQADKATSSSLSNQSPNTESSSKPTDKPPREASKHQQSFHQTRVGAHRTTSTPFITTIEPQKPHPEPAGRTSCVSNSSR